MKPFVVIFSKNTARIVKGIDVNEYRGRADCLINPDLTAVHGLPPHCWCIVDGKLATLLDADRKRNFNELHGISAEPQTAVRDPNYTALKIISAVVLAASLTYLKLHFF